MNINATILILILFFSSCSSEREIRQNLSSSDDVTLYNTGMTHLKKKNMKRQLTILLNLKFNTRTHPGLQEGN